MRLWCSLNEPTVHPSAGMIVPGWNDIPDRVAGNLMAAQAAIGAGRYLHETAPAPLPLPTVVAVAEEPQALVGEAAESAQPTDPPHTRRARRRGEQGDGDGSRADAARQ